MANFWLEPVLDGSDRVGDIKSSHLDGQRVQALVVEFMNQLTADEWMNAAYIIPKIHYGSKVDATPLNRPNVSNADWYQYEVKARFDSGHDKTCLVIELEHFFRSRYYGTTHREIWIPIEQLRVILNKVYPEPIPDDVVNQWKYAASLSYSKQREHKDTFVCTLRNGANSSTAFKMGLNEKAENVNV